MKTLEEMANHTQLTDGTLVVVDIPGIIKFPGNIVGVSSQHLITNYIVECLDNTLPNETYQYKVVSIPHSYITPVIVNS